MISSYSRRGWVFLFFAMFTSAAPAEPPALVLLITVDQLRGDMPARVAERVPPGGLRHLLENGAWYTNAHYQHANTETAVGHSTIVTGTTPANHGMVANEWYDPATGTLVYNTEDSAHHLIGEEPKPNEGASPKNLLVSTFGDELVASTGGASRVFSASVKDRGAILPAGHAGKAFWYSRSSGEFVTSTYYYDAYPEWVAQWNAAKKSDAYRDEEWSLSQNLDSYVAGESDDRSFELDMANFGRTFPHAYADDPLTFTRIAFSPAGDELLLDFAKTLIAAEELGARGATDMLALSFSSTDYVGHLFGPNSLESEDNLFRLDRTLANLFAFVDGAVGLDRTLIVLSADHGAPEAPEVKAAEGMDANRHHANWARSPELRAALKEKFGRDDLIAQHRHPYIFLDRAAMEESGLDPAEVEAYLCERIEAMPGFAFAMSRADSVDSKGKSEAEARVIANYHPERSGDVYPVQQPYWFLHSPRSASLGLAAIHGSPWAYDTHVPIVFAGPGIDPAHIDRHVHPADIAATVAAYLGTPKPTGSTGTPLQEVLALAD